MTRGGDVGLPRWRGSGWKKEGVETEPLGRSEKRGGGGGCSYGKRRRWLSVRAKNEEGEGKITREEGEVGTASSTSPGAGLGRRRHRHDEAGGGRARLRASATRTRPSGKRKKTGGGGLGQVAGLADWAGQVGSGKSGEVSFLF